MLYFWGAIFPGENAWYQHGSHVRILYTWVLSTRFLIRQKYHLSGLDLCPDFKSQHSLRSAYLSAIYFQKKNFFLKRDVPAIEISFLYGPGSLRKLNVYIRQAVLVFVFTFFFFKEIHIWTIKGQGKMIYIMGWQFRKKANSMYSCLCGLVQLATLLQV